MRKWLLVVVVAWLAIGPAAAAAQAPSAAWLFLQLSEQAGREANAAASAGRAADARTWQAWSRLYGQISVAPEMETKPALQLTAEQAEAVATLARTATDPRAAALYRASVGLWRQLHDQLARGAPPVADFPKREMLTPIPGLKGTPWAPGAFASAADCASLAHRVRFCEAQVAQMQHENVTGLYGDRGFPLLMQEHQCHKWEKMQAAYCLGR
jgi:hypothetical protein